MTDQCPASTTPRAFAVTNWSVLAIAAPMTLAYLTTPLLGIVDTAVVGQLGDAARCSAVSRPERSSSTLSFRPSISSAPERRAWSRRPSVAAIRKKSG
jgi:hypothetical protein